MPSIARHERWSRRRSAPPAGSGPAIVSQPVAVWRCRSESARKPSTGTERSARPDGERGSGRGARGACASGGVATRAPPAGTSARPASKARATVRRTPRVSALGDAGAEEHRLELVGRDRARVEVALPVAALERAEPIALLPRARCPRRPCRAPSSRRGGGSRRRGAPARGLVPRSSTNGFAIFSASTGNRLQVVQRRVAGTEVVDRDPDAERSAARRAGRRRPGCRAACSR